LDPTKKHNIHVLWGQVQAVCMGRVGAGGVVMGTAVMPAHPHCRQFCVAFLFLRVGMPAMRGSNRSQDGTGHGKKKAHSLREGKAREGNTSGGMALGTGETWDDPTGRGQGSNTGLSLSPLIFVPCFFRSGCAGSGRGGGRSQDWSGHCKKKQRPLTWRREGNASGGMASETGGTREDTTGQDPESIHA